MIRVNYHLSTLSQLINIPHMIYITKTVVPSTVKHTKWRQIIDYLEAACRAQAEFSTEPFRFLDLLSSMRIE